MVLILLLLMLCAKFHQVTMEYNEGAGALVMFIDPVFTCNDGTRIRGRQFCDGNKDCSQYEDEYSCPDQGTTQGSFVTYKFDQSKLRGKIEYMLELKTASTDGIIFYVTEPTHKDYVTLYLNESKLHFSFVCGSISASVTSEALVNEGEWHTIEFTIDQNLGLLKVDQQTQTIRIGCSSFNIAAPYYLGGVDVPTMNTSVMTHLQGFNRTFVGCLKKFTANRVEYEKPTSLIGVVPCSSQVVAGTFFPATGGYLKAFDQFKVGKDFEINLEIKPRNISGVLLGVHGKKFFLVLQMINGAVKFTADSGNGPYYTIFKPQTSDYFCDDRWHLIKAVKSKALVILSVDGTGAEYGTEPNGIKLTNTNNPLYVGGYPPDLSNARGIETNIQYVGCMRNLQINGQNYNFSSFTTFGSVMHNAICPT
ncbi:laminin subunit alpha-1-like [Planococcus citri]|uniref:laminin subunit alpha-1-like n=1 Tax=Planococcus citri TaxID=170843 RepID=UPI0031F98A71